MMKSFNAVLVWACLALLVAARVDALSASVPACAVFCQDNPCTIMVTACTAFSANAWPALDAHLKAVAGIKLKHKGPVVATLSGANDSAAYVASGIVLEKVSIGFKPALPLVAVEVHVYSSADLAVYAPRITALCEALTGDVLAPVSIGTVRVYASGQFFIECLGVPIVGR